MKHTASPQFWDAYEALPRRIRLLADSCFVLLKTDPRHPSLHLKRIGRLWSVRVGEHYRALGIDDPDGTYWIWIGSHADYDKKIGRQR